MLVFVAVLPVVKPLGFLVRQTHLHMPTNNISVMHMSKHRV